MCWTKALPLSYIPCLRAFYLKTLVTPLQPWVQFYPKLLYCLRRLLNLSCAKSGELTLSKRIEDSGERKGLILEEIIFILSSPHLFNSQKQEPVMYSVLYLLEIKVVETIAHISVEDRGHGFSARMHTSSPVCTHPNRPMSQPGGSRPELGGIP